MVSKLLKSRALPTLIILTSIIMIVYGYIHGEAEVVLDKAIKICLECVGIG